MHRAARCRCVPPSILLQPTAFMLGDEWGTHDRLGLTKPHGELLGFQMHSRPTSRFRRTVAAGLSLVPGVSLALGGEGIAEGIIKAFLILVAWLVATLLTLSWKRNRFSGAWYVVWAVRLSLPAFILWGVYVTPLLDKARQERNAQVQSAAKQSFEALCKVHAPGATRILQVESGDTPKTIYVEELGGSSEPWISQQLVGCIQRRTPVCQNLKLEAVEWAWQHSSGFGPCKVGPDLNRSGQCLPEFNRTEYAAGQPKVIPIDKPTAKYIIRVQRGAQTFKPDEVRRFRVSLENADTGNVLASTELLMSWVSPPCQSFAGEVTDMLTRSFSGR